MDSSQWRPAPPNNNPMESNDWRSQLQSDSRQLIVNKIMETLKRHLPFSGQEELPELKKIAVRFEEKIYSAATSQSDYLRNISLKMLSVETKSQSTIAGSLANNPAGSSRNPMESVPQNMQPEGHNQGQAVPMPLAGNQPRQQMLAQNLPGNIASAGVQSTTGLASTMPPVSGMNQNPISNVINQASKMQNMADGLQIVVGDSLGQGMASNVFKNQNQIQGRQQVPPGQQSQQHHYMYQQQMQQNYLKQKQQQQLRQGNMPHSLMKPHIQQQQQQQQQNLLQPNQLQPSQQMGIPSSGAMLHQHPQSTLASVHQSAQSMLQQHPQSALRQQQASQQAPLLHQQQMEQSHQQVQTSQPQQQMMGSQTNTTNMQRAPLIGQQNGMSDMAQQQQRLMNPQNNLTNLQQQQQQLLISQQNNLTNTHQQHVGPQSNVSGLQQQLHGTQSCNSGMQANQHPVHMLPQKKRIVSQENQQPVSGLLANQGQHSQPSQPQIMTQTLSQSAQLQQQLAMNQQQRDIQPRLQPSVTLMQPHSVTDLQKQMFQSQRALPEASSTSVDSASQSEHANSANWQEEAHQKISVMKDRYLPDISELYQKISAKLQLYESIPGQYESIPRQPKADQLRIFKTRLERIITFLQVPKNNINPAHREKLGSYEKEIANFLNSNGPRKVGPQLQPGQVPQHMQTMQQGQSQNLQCQSHETRMNPTTQSSNIQGPVGTSLQQNPMSSLSGVSNSPQTMMGPGQGGLASLQQGVVGFFQQNSVNSQQNNMSLPSSQSGVSMLRSNMSNGQSNSSSLQQQHMTQQQEQSFMQSQQLKQQQKMLQQRQMIMQQRMQQLHQQQTKQQKQSGLSPAHQIPQLQQISDVNEIKLRQGLGIKPGVLPQHHAAAQVYMYHQLGNPGVSYPMSSLQMLQASSPQLIQNSSPQIDQPNLLMSLTKAGTPLQSANSPFVVPSPSTPLAPSPMPGDLEKLNSNVSPLTNHANMRIQQSAVPPAPTQSLAIGTPGIPASPLPPEFSNQDTAHANTAAVVTKPSVTEQPLDRLIRAVISISKEALTASVNDIGSVVSMIDRIAGSAPGNGSRAAVGEDLVAMTKCQLQAKNYVTQDGSNISKKMKRLTSAMPLMVVSSNSSANGSFEQLVGSEVSDLESTATSRAKRPRIEVNNSLLEEIREINERLIDTMVKISDEDADPAAAAPAASEGGEGITIKCSYNAVALSPNLKSQYAAQMSPIQPLRLLVPSNYPNCSPLLLDKLPVDVGKENEEDLSMMVKSKFSISLRTLSQPMSLGEIAKTWDLCARAVMSEYAQASDGGSFSSRYGSWETVLGA